MTKKFSMLCFVISLAFVGTANAEGTFQIGPQIGYSDIDVSASFYGFDLGESDMDGAAVGLVARYTVPVGEDGVFTGFQAGFAKEFASDELFPDFGDGESSAEWSADIMSRIGYDFGNMALSLAAGVSFVQGKINGIGSPSATDTQWHTGWKIAPGIDYELSENVTLFGQAYYARYDSQAYAGYVAGLDLEIQAKPKVRGVRVGVLYAF